MEDSASADAMPSARPTRLRLPRVAPDGNHAAATPFTLFTSLKHPLIHDLDISLSQVSLNNLCPVYVLSLEASCVRTHDAPRSTFVFTLRFWRALVSLQESTAL